MSTTTTKNLVPAALQPEIDLSKENPAAALEKLCVFADTECGKAIEWYFTRKQAKQRAGVWLRVLGILAVAAAGVIPILGEILEKMMGKPCLNPAWATIALAVAALFIALDRFGGYTSGWIRYVRTGTALCHLQATFRIDWAEQRLTPPPPTDPPAVTPPVTPPVPPAVVPPAVPPADPVRLRIKLCRDFLTKVNELVANETTEWAREFQTALVEIERGTGTKQRPSTHGQAPPLT